VDRDELQGRTKQFALRVFKLVDHLPRSVQGKAIANQLIRCATSVGANYRAACRARSRAEFISKLTIVLEESDESSYWLELIIEGNILAEQKVSALLSESREVTAIIAASRATALKSSMANRKS
jgi:four helix bundle protein